MAPHTRAHAPHTRAHGTAHAHARTHTRTHARTRHDTPPRARESPVAMAWPLHPQWAVDRPRHPRAPHLSRARRQELKGRFLQLSADLTTLRWSFKGYILIEQILNVRRVHMAADDADAEKGKGRASDRLKQRVRATP
eukprot:6964391-Prymnesium_polylepis.1